MLARFRKNPLMLTAVALLVGYPCLAALLPGAIISVAASSLLLVISALVSATIAEDAWHILRRGEIGEGEVALLGLAVLALGSTYRAAYGVAWGWAGFPPSWVGTAASAYGAAMQALGFLLVFVSPGATIEGLRRPNWLVVVGATMAAVVLAYLIGYSNAWEGPQVLRALPPAYR